MIPNMDWGSLPQDINILAWIEEQMQDDDVLLAHAIDGVIWGKKTDNELLLSCDIDHKISPFPYTNTLQQARIFNQHREIFVWIEGDLWYAREIVDTEDISKDDYFDESHILWGTQGKPADHGFTLLSDGSQGLRHIVPIDASRINEKNKRPILKIRHYFGETEAGVTYIKSSRLVNIEVVTYE